MGKTFQRLADRIKQHVPRHVVDSICDEPKKRRGRPPRKRKKPDEDYQSAFACHLVSNTDCCENYSDSDFKILAHGRIKCHLDVLEAMYINVLDPVLCRQKRFVTYLTLFKHAHSSTVDKT